MPGMDESEHTLGTALQCQLQSVRERGFCMTVIDTDLHRTFLKLCMQFPGVLINTGGMKDFVYKVDAKINKGDIPECEGWGAMESGQHKSR